MKKIFIVGATGTIIALCIFAGISIASAALTFSGSNISGDGAINIDGANTISIGNSTATGITIGKTAQTLTLPGNLNLSAMTQGSIPFLGASGLLSQDNPNLFWDATNHRLGLGTATPAYTLDVAGNGINIASGQIYGYSGVAMAQGSTSLNNYYFGGAGNLTGTGTVNVAIGISALPAVTTGSNNVAVGAAALLTNSTGVENTALGRSALRLNTTGSDNVAVGLSALFSNTTSTFNTAVGRLALTFTTGGGNTALGTGAGITNTTGTNNTFIGISADAVSSELTNATAIGNNAVVGASNSLVLGGTSANAVNVGIGTTTPATTLQLSGTLPTLGIGASSLAGCLEMGNSDGTSAINYITVLNGTISASTSKPAACQ